MGKIDHQPESYSFAPDSPHVDNAAHAYYRRLLKGLTHKLNNHASVVQGFSSLLLMQDQLSEEMRGNLEQMRQSGEEISALMERVLALTASTRPDLQSIQLDEFLQSLEEELREMSRRAGAGFAMQTDTGLPTIECDPTQLREILIELFKNACESASTIGGQITIHAYAPGVCTPAEKKHVDILISNTGLEFPREKIGEAFTPFVTTKPGEHLGLGLTVAAALAKRIEAHLGITSEGETTTAWLSIPVAD